MRTLGKAILNMVSEHVDWKLRQRELARQFYDGQARPPQGEQETEAARECDPSPLPIVHRCVKHAL